MKEKIFINARIIDPSQKMDEKGSLILDQNGKVKAIGKNVKKSDDNSSVEVEIYGKKYNAIVQRDEPVWDPRNERLKA